MPFQLSCAAFQFSCAACRLPVRATPPARHCRLARVEAREGLAMKRWEPPPRWESALQQRPLVEHVESRVIGVNMAQDRDVSTARKCRTRVCGASRRGRIKLKASSGFHIDILAQSIARQVCAQFAVAWRGLCRRTSRRGSAADSHWFSSRRSARRIRSVGATSTALGLAQRGGREHRQAANAHLGRT